MSGSREAADAALELLIPLGDVELRRYFGGWALRCAGRQFAIVMDELYLRVDDDQRAALAAVPGAHPFTYVAAGREVTVDRYWTAPGLSEAQLLAFARVSVESRR